MVVLSGRIQDKFRLEILKNWQHQRIKYIEYALVRRCGWKGNVYCPAKGFRTSELIYKARSRVKCPSILVERDKKHIRIIVEDFLCSVSVVDVSIYNCNPADPIFFPEVFDQDSLVVDIAKTPVSMSNCHCMMPGRADKGKSVFNFPCHKSICKNQAAACCNKVGNCSLVCQEHRNVPGQCPCNLRAEVCIPQFQADPSGLLQRSGPVYEQTFFPSG